MSDTFTAAVVEEFGPTLNIREADLPEPGRNQALVRNLASGICHTDVHAAEGDWPVKPEPPFIPGHEGVGEVVKLGPGEHTVEVGDIVGNVWLWSACGVCEKCRTGWETLCDEAEYGGYTVDGSFGEYMLVDARYAPLIPEGADPMEVGPILCAGVTVYKGLKQTEVRPGQWVVISGIGGLGHIAIKLLHAMGCEVTAFSSNPAKEQEVLAMGADRVVNSRDPEALKALAGQFDLIINLSLIHI